MKTMGAEAMGYIPIKNENTLTTTTHLIIITLH